MQRSQRGIRFLHSVVEIGRQQFDTFLNTSVGDLLSTVASGTVVTEEEGTFKSIGSPIKLRMA